MRERPEPVSIAVGVALLTLIAAALYAQTITRVQDIRADPQSVANEVVTIEGRATQWVESTATTTSFYFLKDDWGGVIKVRTSRERPLVGERYRVSGPVGIDAFNRNDVYISEERRIHLRGQGGLPPDAGEGTGDEGEGGTGTGEGESMDWRIVALVAAIVVVLAVLVGLLVWLVKRSGAPVPLDSAAEAEGEPTVVEGTTIKMHAPPPGTLKILPGRFEVVEGDDTVEEIRFFKVKAQAIPEVTFGRAAGAPYTHIQLKPMTVSSRHAKLTLVDGQWILTNFALDTSNPTLHNGIEMGVDAEVPLAEGDRVTMGEVVLSFHES